MNNRLLLSIAMAAITAVMFSVAIFDLTKRHYLGAVFVTLCALATLFLTILTVEGKRLVIRVFELSATIEDDDFDDFDDFDDN